MLSGVALGTSTLLQQRSIAYCPCYSCLRTSSSSRRSRSFLPRLAQKLRSSSAMASTPTARADRDYTAAITALNTLQSNAATIEAIRKSGPQNHLALPEMIEYLERIGYSCSELDKLNVIHITGTKGKGSTAAFCDSILRQVGEPSTKIGLYTSPHMVAVRERIRINGEPIAEDTFTKYFWEVWDRLEENPQRVNPITPLRPVYFRYMTLLAFHIFSSLQVSATLLEVGIGGMYDSTNIVPHSIVAGISALGLDHVFVLGNTLELIAEQKAGIFKEGAHALSVPQKDGAMSVIKTTATKSKVSTFDVVPPLSSPPTLGLPGAHQVSNASLAVAMVRRFLASPAGKWHFPLATIRIPSDLTAELSEPERVGLTSARWPGRCQTVSTGERDAQPGASMGPTWFLDGAHTTDSLAYCAEWFVQASQDSCSVAEGDEVPHRALIFNCTNGRTGHELLYSLLHAIEQRVLKKTDHQNLPAHEVGEAFPLARRFFKDVIFCTNVTYSDGGSAGDLMSLTVDPNDVAALKTQLELKRAFSKLLGAASTPSMPTVHISPSIQDAMRLIAEKTETPATEGQGQKNRAQVHCLVTGSLHLVGGVLAHLQDQGWVDKSLRSVTEIRQSVKASLVGE